MTQHVRPIFVSYYTLGTPYEREAGELKNTLRAFGLEHDITGVANLGDWCANCAMKARVIAEAMDRYPTRPIVFVDADARIRQYPAHFTTLWGTCDVAFYRLNGELLSGTLYFASTPAALQLVQGWQRRCAEQPNVWDQQLLDQEIKSTAGLRVAELPPQYVQIFDTMRDCGAPVIEHMQASRRFREAV